MAEIKETIWEYVQGESTGTFYTAQKKWIAKVHRWKSSHPDDVDIRAVNPDGSLVVHLPRDWFKLSPKRAVSDAQREASRERFLKLRSEGRL